MPVTYREPTPDDIDTLSALGSETFVETFGTLYSKANLDRFLEDAYSPRAVSEDMRTPKMTYLVAEEAARMVGYCKIYDGVSHDYDSAGKKVMELKQLYILASHHGSGIADHMMRWAFDKAHLLGADQMLLSVFNENLRAQNFYKKHGFSFHADTVFMVGDHADHEFLFIKYLK